jgi:hypothetical protein
MKNWRRLKLKVNLSFKRQQLTRLSGFELDKPTLFAGVLVQSGNLLQITESSINLVDKNQRPLVSQPIQVSLCSVNLHSGQILLATRSKLIYIQTDGQTLQTVAEKEFKCDISCLDLALIGEFGVCNWHFEVLGKICRSRNFWNIIFYLGL